MTARKKIIQGGSSAGKTFAILPILIDKAIKEEGLAISVVSESIPHLRRGALRDFKKIMQATGRWNAGQFNKSLLTYTFMNGSFIEFFSANEESTQRGARRQILFVNECNNILFDSYHALAIRTEKEIFLDFNPANEFWAHTEVLQEEGSELLILTYKDNEGLPANVLEEFEEAQRKAANGSAYWKNWCRVYVDGLIGSLQGVIYEDFETVPTIPHQAQYIGMGLDFGYTNPAAAVALWEMDGQPYFDEVFYLAGLNNKEIARKIKDYAAKHKLNITTLNVVCDSAEPKSIAEIDADGVDAMGISKKEVYYSIQLMQQQTFFITEESTNVLKEVRAYKWEESRDGTKKEKPVKVNDHAMDAMRYINETHYDGRYSGNYTVSVL